MIKGLGTDIVEVERMAKKVKKNSFLMEVFTIKEIEYCQLKKHPAQHYAARFAAKEAYMKAIGKGWSKEANFKEIEITKTKEGAPSILLSGNTLLSFTQLNYKHIFVSISHTTSMASSTVIITA